jgi:hypothetical protein
MRTAVNMTVRRTEKGNNSGNGPKETGIPRHHHQLGKVDEKK